MKIKYFKLVPVSVAAEIKPGEPCVAVWDAGFITGPKQQHIDWTRHIIEGSAAVLNIDTLIREQKEVI